MKMIFRIARTELRTLFFSPIAWFLMIVFLIQCGIVYFNQLETVARFQEMSGPKFNWMEPMTSWVFLSQPGLFNRVMQNLYLYVPLLTMGLISRETSSGTIKLLYSSPISVSEIVLGKYLAMLVYSLVLVAIVGIFVVSGMFHIQHAEKNMLFSSMMGFYLLLCAYAAIGLFMSSLTGYQVVAAISTFVMIGVLSYIGGLWQRIGFVRELTYYLSINGRTEHMLQGLITTKDVLYFGVIVYMFLGFAIFKLKSGMESKPAAVKAGRYVALVASALLIGYVSSLPGLIGYFDVTVYKDNTLTPRVQKIVKDLGDEPLEVTAYANLLERNFYLGSPGSYNRNKARWESYIRFKSNIQLNTVMYYDSAMRGEEGRYMRGKPLKDLADKYAKSMDVDLKEVLTPEQIRGKIDLRPEANRYVMQLKWKGHTTFLRVFDDMIVWPTETEVAAALQRLQHASLPKIGFVTGDLERAIDRRGDRDYKTLTNLPEFRYSLVNQGFDVTDVALDSGDIPKDISALVLADPKVEMPAPAMEKLKQYIRNGGNLLIAGEPGKQALLAPLVRELGIGFMEGTVIQESRNDAPNFINTYVLPVAGTFYTPMQKTIADSLKLTMPGAAGITYNDSTGFKVLPLVRTSAKASWNRIKPIDPDMMISARGPNGDIGEEDDDGAESSDPPARGPVKRRDTLGTVRFSAVDGDVKGPITTVVGLTRMVGGREQHIVVAGDADFMSNKELTRPQTANFVFSTSLIRWISGGEFPIDTSRPDARDKRVALSLDQVKFVKVIYLWVVPAILLAFGTVLLIRRKRK